MISAGGIAASACYQPVAQPIKPPAVEVPVVAAEKPVAVEKPQEVVSEQTSYSAEVNQVLTETNNYRAQNGLPALKLDSRVMATAQSKAQDMATNRYFSHTSPTLGSPFDQMKAEGITYRRAAENIAMGQRSAKEVVDAWMKSPGHRANILDRNLTHIGIGYTAKGNYWVQQFITK